MPLLVYSLPIGRTVFKGKLDRDEYNDFEGCFVKTEVEPDDDITLMREGDKWCSIQFDLGLNTVLYELGFFDMDGVLKYGVDCGNRLREWEKNQGGELEAYKHGERSRYLYGVALYTVLSVHKPREESRFPRDMNQIGTLLSMLTMLVLRLDW